MSPRTPKLRFPNENLVPRRGKLFAKLFENKGRLPRAIYWTFSVTFAPLHYGDGKDADDFECSILCEWLRFPVLDWRDLKGRRFERPEGQISFYMTEHDPTENMAIDFSERTGRSFVIDISMAVDSMVTSGAMQ